MHRWHHQSTSVWKIALGVSLGILVAATVGVAARLWFAQKAIEHIAEQAQQITAHQQRVVSDMLRKSQEQQEERQRAAAQRIADEQAAQAAKQRAEAEALQTLLDERSRREAAWMKYYRKPRHCDDPPTNEALVECANGHIRAKRSFDVAYDAGKI